MVTSIAPGMLVIQPFRARTNSFSSTNRSFRSATSCLSRIRNSCFMGQRSHRPTPNDLGVDSDGRLLQSGRTSRPGAKDVANDETALDIGCPAEHALVRVGSGYVAAKQRSKWVRRRYRGACPGCADTFNCAKFVGD